MADHDKKDAGDMEIRILRDGRVVLVAPDEDLIEVAERIDPEHPDLRRRKQKDGNNDRVRQCDGTDGERSGD